MKIVIALGVGFYLGRLIYINQDKKEARKNEEAIKERLTHFLSTNGFTKKELKTTTEKIIGHE